MAPRDATRRLGGGVSAAAYANISTAENSAAIINGQAIRHPIQLSMARARLLELIRRRPAPTPEPSPPRDWVRIPTTVATPQMLASLIGVTPRTIHYWRRGEHQPRWRNRRKLLLLQAMVRRARP
jgi:hypothetical protein